MSDWKLICQVDEIPVLGSRRVTRAQGMDVALFRNGQGEVFALLDRCPHKGGPLSQGIVFGNSVACPLHNWTIGLEDGMVREPDLGCVQRFAVKVENGAVHLNPMELATLGIEFEAPVAGPKRGDRTAMAFAHTPPAMAPNYGPGGPNDDGLPDVSPLPHAGEG
ncbi:MAG: nirD [Rhodoferax sp.]|nr:nirD [Rhodoferax sp.]